jgi:hypothetical protein
VKFPGKEVYSARVTTGHQLISRRATRMAIERIVQYGCKVCGRRIDVTRSGDIYEEPVYCCGLETAEVNVPEAPSAPAVKKKAVKKAATKKPAKKAKKKAVTKKAAKKKATKKKATKKKATKKKAAKKAVKKKATKKRR